jgi:hypothetical protein
MRLPKRDYHYKGADTGGESKLFWIMAIIGLAIVAALIYFVRYA